MSFRLGLGMGLKINSPGAGGGWSPVWLDAPGSAADVRKGLLGYTWDDSGGSGLLRVNRYYAVWMAKISGTAATLTLEAADASYPYDFQVSVDGGEFANVTPSSGDIVLFSGLSDAEHTVVVNVHISYVEQIGLAASGNLLAVTGANPRFRVPAYRHTVFEDTTGISTAARFVTADTLNAGFEPDYYAKGAPGSMIMTRFAPGDARELWVGAKGLIVYVQFDHGERTAIEMDVTATSVNNMGGYIEIPANTSVVSIYTQAYSGSSGQWLAIGTDAEITFPDTPRLYHWGHSIVEGAGVGGAIVGPPLTDLPLTADWFGYVGGNFGVSGDTINALQTRIDAEIAEITVEAGDIAWIDIGRNDGGGSLDAGEIADYELILDSVYAAGFSRILCLGVMPINTLIFEATNVSIKAIVDDQRETSGRANVFYVDRTAYDETAITIAGTHPDDEGYRLEMFPLNKTTYADYLSLTAPDWFAAADWSVADQGDGTVRITITALPDSAQTITRIDYRVDEGTWASTGLSDTGTYDISGLTSGTAYKVEIRAVSAGGNGLQSIAKTETPTDVPAAFSVGNWSILDATTGGQIDVTINALPADNGDTITDIEYRVDGGSWTSSVGTTSFSITGLTDDVAVDIELRAVNGNGAGPASDVKSATPTMSAPITEAQINAFTPHLFITLSDTTKLWQDTGSPPTTQASANNDPVRQWDDISGNSRNFVAPTDAKRPLFKTATPSLLFDGTDDTIGYTGTPGTSDCSLFFAFKSTDTIGIIFKQNDGTGNHVIGYFINGNASTATDNVGSAVMYVDGVSIASTRDAYYDSFIGGTWHIGELRNADLSGWTGLFLSGYDAVRVAGEYGPVVVIPTANFDSSDRDNIIVRYLQEQVGLA